MPPAIAPTFDEGGDEEVFVAGDPNGDGGGVAGFGGVVLGGGLEDGGLLVGVGGDGGLVGAEVGGTTGVGVGGTTGDGVGGDTEVGGGGELDEGVVGDDALVVVGLYTLAAKRIP